MKTLGITETIDVTRPLREFGLDSLMSVTLVNRLESALGIKISTVKLIQGPSVEQLVNEIIPELPGGEHELAPITLQPQSETGSWPATLWSADEDEGRSQPVEVQAEPSAFSFLSRTDPTTDIGDRPHPVRIASSGGISDWLVTVGPTGAERPVASRSVILRMPPSHRPAT